MAITIQMGVTPKPTCTINLVSNSYSGTTLTAEFSYSLSPINGASYWGYGVNLEYGGTSSLGSSLTLRTSSQSQWSSNITGNLTITKTGVISSPQSFYFRLNSNVATDGTPGATSSLSVSFGTITVAQINSVSGNGIEEIIRFTFNQSSGAKYGFYMYAWADWQSESDAFFIGSRYYEAQGVPTSWGEVQFQLNDDELKDIYAKWGTDFGPDTRSATLSIRLETYNGETYLGFSRWDELLWVHGTTQIKANNTWKYGTPFIRISGTWKKSVAYVKQNGTWSRGNTIPH